MEVNAAARPDLRDPGVDLARGLAVLLMIQTHAYGGWASAAARQTLGYQVSRVLGAVPAPLFLLLAGVGMALGSQAALRRGQGPARVRAQLLRQGLKVVGYGYLISLVYGIIEGRFRAADLLRADILHCIGLSMMVCAYFLVARSHPFRRAAVLAAMALVFGPVLSRLIGPRPASYLAPLLALVVDVPPYTRFPLLPLCCFVALGICVGHLLPAGRLRGGPLLLLALVLAAAACRRATLLLVSAWGGVLSRTHPAIVLNLLDGGARALSVLVLGLWAAPFLRRHADHALYALWVLGRGSLLAYAFHVPFCYGRPARLLAHRLDMTSASVALVALVLLTGLFVWGYRAIRSSIAQGCRRSPC